MQLSGEHTFDAPRETVWDALQDPDVLTRIMPGGEGFERAGEDTYTGFLNIKVGPVQGRFEGTIQLSDKVPPERYNMTVDGKGGPGFVKASGSIELADEGSRTRLNYALDAQIGGRLASVGQRLVDASARSIARQSLESLNEYLTSRTPEPRTSGSPTSDSGAASKERGPTSGTERASPDGPEAPAYRAPSQGKVAMNVARDVAVDLIPARRRPWFVGAGVLVLVAVLYLIFR